MNNTLSSSSIRKSIYLALIVSGLLLIPMTAMQFTDEVHWTVYDFILAAILLFTVGFIYIFLIQKIKISKSRWFFTAILVIAFLFIWAELAVGVFR